MQGGTSGSIGSMAGLMGRRNNLIFGVAIAALAVLYAGIFIAWPDKWFADDSYFYLQVAWNFARGLGSTFNGIMPTNGYHPLWMLLCALVYTIVPSKTAGVHGIAVLVSLLDGLMLWTVRGLLKQVAGDLWILAFALLIPFCFQSQLGTEGALSGLFLALVMLHAYEMSESPTTRTALLFNLEAALAVLSRLDNIFIIGFVWIAVWIGLTGEGRQRGRKLQLAMLPIYVVLWGGYLGVNWIYFHTLQPISGMLKGNSAVTHSLKAHFPHTAWLAMLVIVVCFGVVVARRRDRFFRVVEVPFLLGVLCHGTYILLKMSNETRWSWYYTSWILLGAILLARAGSVVLAERRWLAAPVSAMIVLLLAAAWVKVSYHRIYLGPDFRPSAAFKETVKDANIHSAFVYDEPGVLAYYSDIRVIPLDGLMGDMGFQHDLATKGVNAVALADHIDGFMAPPVPYDETDAKEYCEKMFLSAVKLNCVADGPGRWQVTGADIYSRVPNVAAGNLRLDHDQLVWSEKKTMAVWRIHPSAGTR
jgi:hypothetical protein